MSASNIDIRTALLKLLAESSVLDMAEIALGLICVAVDRETGTHSIRCASEYYFDEANFEYFGREDIGEEEFIPSNYHELAAYEAGYSFLAHLARTGLQKHVDFWFPAAISRRI